MVSLGLARNLGCGRLPRLLKSGDRLPLSEEKGEWVRECASGTERRGDRGLQSGYKEKKQTNKWGNILLGKGDGSCVILILRPV